MQKSIWFAGALLTSSVAMAGNADTLYGRIGGKEATLAITKDLIARVKADARIAKKFARSDAPRLEYNLNGYICIVLEGDCGYAGENLKTAHKGMGVTAAEFDAFMEDVGAALDQQKIVDPDRAAVLKALGSSRATVVEVQGKNTGTELPAGFKPAPPLNFKEAPAAQPAPQ